MSKLKRKRSGYGLNGAHLVEGEVAKNIKVNMHGKGILKLI